MVVQPHGSAATEETKAQSLSDMVMLAILAANSEHIKPVVTLRTLVYTWVAFGLVMLPPPQTSHPRSGGGTHGDALRSTMTSANDSWRLVTFPEQIRTLSGFVTSKQYSVVLATMSVSAVPDILEGVNIE